MTDNHVKYVNMLYKTNNQNLVFFLLWMILDGSFIFDNFNCVLKR